ncbi:hypothetical protein Nmul_A1466 [Nitrosospira multiformis ATCC 25196]|uniref:Uncharacterized protein n=1 Tax=Nitrosospira multiformis (strain ATCC 25196 / NCIMB 11849 / C 71) TaxID=323848 RepID=Q2Y902_NITMU|nr:hypothetical protein Nmul_A1466 [Nitrosospira multiformis ATCC 25196]
MIVHDNPQYGCVLYTVTGHCQAICCYQLGLKRKERDFSLNYPTTAKLVFSPHQCYKLEAVEPIKHPLSPAGFIPTFKRNSVIKKFVMLLIFGLPYSNATAQEVGSREMGVPEGIVPVAGSTAEGASSILGTSFYPPLYSPALINSPGVSAHAPGTQLDAYSLGRPVIVLPIQPYIGTVSGFQYPGSYMPHGTPLHRFNGYIVCNPPNLNRDAEAGAVAGAGGRQIIKITSTRSPSIPGYSGPCPIYTINGELPPQKSHSTIRPRGTPSTQQQGRHHNSTQ